VKSIGCQKNDVRQSELDTTMSSSMVSDVVYSSSRFV
jgi:hypothetical protein